MLLLSVEEMKDWEKQADERGYSFAEMMKTAGNKLAEFILERWGDNDQKVITGLVGGGMNGADTVIALTALQNAGWKTMAILLDPAGQPGWVMTAAEKAGCELLPFDQQPKLAIQAIKDSPYILDGILGTGFKLPMRVDLARMMSTITPYCQGKVIIAVDCPSGVDCASGSVASGSLNATLTACMEAVKIGLVKMPAFSFAGEIVCLDVGIARKLHRKIEGADLVIDLEMVKSRLPAREMDSHKGTYGTVLVCGGSVNYPGAPVFASRSAYLSGAGLVKTAVPERIYEVVVGNCLESTWMILDDENGVIAESACRLIRKESSAVECLALGPGIGQEETTLRFLLGLVEDASDKKPAKKMGLVPPTSSPLPVDSGKFPPMVIDADGLKLLAKIKGWQDKLKEKSIVLTPHPGEMSVLTGIPVSEIQNDRIEICRKFAGEWQQCIVLKGALTVIGSPDGRVAVCPVATSALAKAGSGDVLTGLIAGLLAQGASVYDAAVAGVWIHANAGLLAAEMVDNEYSVVLEDLMSAIPEVLSSLKPNNP